MIDASVFAVAAALLFGSGIALAALRPDWIVEHPRAVLAVLAALTVGCALVLVRFDPPGLRIEVDASSEPLLRRNDPARDVYRQAVLDFGSDDVYVIAMHTDDVFRRAELQVLESVTDGIESLPGVRGVESLVDVYEYRYDPEGDWIDVSPFIDAIPEDDASLARLRERALEDPIYTRTIVSSDGRTAALNVTFQEMTDGEFVALDLDGRIRAVLDQHAGNGRRFYVTGRPHIRTQAHHLLVRDMVVLIPIAVAVAALLLYVMTGSLRGTLVPLASNLTSTFWAFGAMALVGRDLTLITLVLGPMLICVGAVYGVHVLARYDELAEGAPDGRTAALQTLRYTRTPVLIAGLTTMVGFGALLLADVQAVTELGSFAVFGIASVTLLSLTGVPASLSLLPLRAGEQALYGPRTGFSLAFRHRLESVLNRVSGVCTRHTGPVLVFWLAVTISAASLLPRIVVDTDFLMFFMEDSRVRTEFARVNDLLTGAVPIYVLAHGPGGGTFREPEMLRAVERMHHEIERLDGVSHVLSAIDLVRVANRALHEGDAAEHRVPERRAAVAELMFLIPKEKLRVFANSDQSKANLVVRTGQIGSAAIRDLESRIREAIVRAEVPASIRTDVTGNTILINRSADGIAGNQGLQVGLAALTILLLVTAVFRSLRLGLIAMVPNVVPVLLFFGFLGAGVATLSIPTSLIGCIALGIAVDDTVHFLVSYRRLRESGLDVEEAVRTCTATVGRPIATTSIMLVIGFLVITVSGFATLREFGYLTAITMGTCLCTDLGLLPALVTRLRA